MSKTPTEITKLDLKPDRISQAYWDSEDSRLHEGVIMANEISRALLEGRKYTAYYESKRLFKLLAKVTEITRAEDSN